MSSQQPAAVPYDELRERFAACGQGHVFRFWGELDAAARGRLASQAAGIDLEALLRAYRRTQELTAPAARSLAPAPIERLPERGGSAARRVDARDAGQQQLAQGLVAAMVVAGGQGTRLGFEGPKGAFPIGPLTGRPLFGLQAQKLRRARSRYGVPIPWIVMTSPATDAPTRKLFAEEDGFGLPQEDLFFLCQGTVPAFDFEGRLMLDRRDHIAESPDGHGGAFSALRDSGALSELRSRGITTLAYYQVDNPLVRLMDPVLLGLHALEDAQMAGKVVRKRTPEEKMGVVARVDGRVGIVEYTELDDGHRYATDAAGELLYWAGSIAIHAFEVEFVERIARHAERVLPYHASAKKIPTLDAAGHPQTPGAPNGHKLERFVFDAFPHAERVAVLEVRRDEEYSPVKNAKGGDSPATARRDLMRLYRRWLQAAGVVVPPEASIEIDHSVIDSEDDARASGIRRPDDAPHAIRLDAGAT